MALEMHPNYGVQQYAGVRDPDLQGSVLAEIVGANSVLFFSPDILGLSGRRGASYRHGQREREMGVNNHYCKGRRNFAGGPMPFATVESRTYGSEDLVVKGLDRHSAPPPGSHCETAHFPK